MATHSSVLAWRIPGAGEPSGLPSMGSHRVGHDWSDLAAARRRILLTSVPKTWVPKVQFKLLIPRENLWACVIPLLICVLHYRHNPNLTAFLPFLPDLCAPLLQPWLCTCLSVSLWFVCNESCSTHGCVIVVFEGRGELCCLLCHPDFPRIPEMCRHHPTQNNPHHCTTGTFQQYIQNCTSVKTTQKVFENHSNNMAERHKVTW